MHDSQHEASGSPANSLVRPHDRVSGTLKWSETDAESVAGNSVRVQAPPRKAAARLSGQLRPVGDRSLPEWLPAGCLIRVSPVELRGIEPLTSSMPWKRSTN